MNDSELLRLIATQLATVPDFGQVQFHIKKHIGSFSNTDVVKLTSYRYTKDEPNVSVTTDMLRLVKQITDAQLTGSLGFSVQFKHGKAEQMQVQDFKKL